MYMDFMKIVFIGNLEPDAGQVDLDVLNIHTLPVLTIHRTGNLEHTAHDELRQLHECIIIFIFLVQIVGACISCFAGFAVFIAVGGKQFNQLRINCFSLVKAFGQ